MKVDINNNHDIPLLELETMVTMGITCLAKCLNRFLNVKALVGAFSWLKVPTSAFTFKNLLRHFAKQVITHGNHRFKL